MTPDQRDTLAALLWRIHGCDLDARHVLGDFLEEAGDVRAEAVRAVDDRPRRYVQNVRWGAASGDRFRTVILSTTGDHAFQQSMQCRKQVNLSMDRDGIPHQWFEADAVELLPPAADDDKVTGALVRREVLGLFPDVDLLRRIFGIATYAALAYLYDALRAVWPQVELTARTITSQWEDGGADVAGALEQIQNMVIQALGVPAHLLGES